MINLANMPKAKVLDEELKEEFSNLRKNVIKNEQMCTTRGQNSNFCMILSNLCNKHAGKLWYNTQESNR